MKPPMNYIATINLDSRITASSCLNKIIDKKGDEQVKEKIFILNKKVGMVKKV